LAGFDRASKPLEIDVSFDGIVHQHAARLWLQHVDDGRSSSYSTTTCRDVFGFGAVSATHMRSVRRRGDLVDDQGGCSDA